MKTRPPRQRGQADCEWFGWSSGRGSEGVGPSTSRYKATIPKSTRRDPRGRVWESRSPGAAGTPKTHTLVRARQTSKVSNIPGNRNPISNRSRYPIPIPYPLSLPFDLAFVTRIDRKDGERRHLEARRGRGAAATTASGCVTARRGALATARPHI